MPNFEHSESIKKQQPLFGYERNAVIIWAQVFFMFTQQVPDSKVHNRPGFILIKTSHVLTICGLMKCCPLWTDVEQHSRHHSPSASHRLQPSSLLVTHGVWEVMQKQTFSADLGETGSRPVHGVNYCAQRGWHQEPLAPGGDSSGNTEL